MRKARARERKKDTKYGQAWREESLMESAAGAWEEVRAGVNTNQQISFQRGRPRSPGEWSGRAGGGSGRLRPGLGSEQIRGCENERTGAAGGSV